MLVTVAPLSSDLFAALNQSLHLNNTKSYKNKRLLILLYDFQQDQLSKTYETLLKGSKATKVIRK